MFKGEHKLKAETLFGLEKILAKEIEEAGGNNISTYNRTVEFTAENEALYKINLQSRTALNVIKEIARFKIESKKDLYDGIDKIKWTLVFKITQSFSVKIINKARFIKGIETAEEDFRETIVWTFKRMFDRRPNGEKFDPNIIIKIFITDDECVVFLDSSGRPLNKRLYAEDSGFDPLNPVLAAGMIMQTGWNGKTNFIDPMCGAGSLLVEASMIAKNQAPNIQRENFAFKQWQNYDADLFNKIIEDLKKKETKINIEIAGGDISERAVKITRRSLNRLGLARFVKLQECGFSEFEAPEGPGLLITNPPHYTKKKLELPEDNELEAEEIFKLEQEVDKENDINFEDESEFYKMIGDSLKQNYKEYKSWLLSANPEYFEFLGFNIEQNVKLFNQNFESEFIELS